MKDREKYILTKEEMFTLMQDCYKRGTKYAVSRIIEKIEAGFLTTTADIYDDGYEMLADIDTMTMFYSGVHVCIKKDNNIIIRRRRNKRT